VDPVRIIVERRGVGTAVSGLPRAAGRGPRTLVLLGDPATFPAEPLLDQVATDLPDLRVVGGMPAGVNGPGECRLVLDDQVVSDGAVGVLLDPATDVEVLVSPGCLPVGPPMVVTRGEGGLIHELAGRPALDRVREVLAGLGQLDPRRARGLGHGLQIGRVVDERLLAPGPGDFVVRDAAGIDPATGSVAVADHGAVGQSVQLFIRDAGAADDALRARLRGIRADGVLVFNSAARGAGLFGFADHDADVVATALGTDAVAGLTVGGQIAPLGGRSFVQRHTLAALLFGTRLAPGDLSGPPADAG
jgi:small ligand-binding sensory domain FIST